MYRYIHNPSIHGSIHPSPPQLPRTEAGRSMLEVEMVVKTSQMILPLLSAPDLTIEAAKVAITLLYLLQVLYHS